MSQPGGGGMGRHLSTKHQAESKKSPGGERPNLSGSASKGGYHAHMDVGRGGKAKHIPQIGEKLS